MDTAALEARRDGIAKAVRKAEIDLARLQGALAMLEELITALGAEEDASDGAVSDRGD